MGIALTWLGAAGRRSLARDLLTEPEERRGEIWAHCPFHQERTPGGAFSYNYEKDQSKCQSAGCSGDLIEIFCAIQGLSKEEGFKEFKKRYAPEGSYRKPETGDRKPEKTRPANYFHQDHSRETAPGKWIERATSFVEHSFYRLIKSEKSLDALQERWGISAETVVQCGFGMNDRDKWIPVTSWGLLFEEKEPGKKKRYGCPGGWCCRS